MSNKKNINWETVDNQMKNLKNPLSFIYEIVKLQDKIDDYNLSLIIRFFFKNQSNITLKYPLFIMINLLNDEFIITKKVVNEYYSSIKNILFYTIMKFKNYFRRNCFGQRCLFTKIILENMEIIFKAHFDAIIRLSGVTKFISQLKSKIIRYIR